MLYTHYAIAVFKHTYFEIIYVEKDNYGMLRRSYLQKYVLRNRKEVDNATWGSNRSSTSIFKGHFNR